MGSNLLSALVRLLTLQGAVRFAVAGGIVLATAWLFIEEVNDVRGLMNGQRRSQRRLERGQTRFHLVQVLEGKETSPVMADWPASTRWTALAGVAGLWFGVSLWLSRKDRLCHTTTSLNDTTLPADDSDD